MPIEVTQSGFAGEGWLPGQSAPVWSCQDGWAYFVSKDQWFFMPYIRDGGPTMEEWQAQGCPVLGAPPSWTPQPEPEASPPLVGQATGAASVQPDMSGAGPSTWLPDLRSSLPPGTMNGTGWVQYGVDLVYARGDGYFFSQKQQKWHHHPEWLTPVPPPPPPLPPALRLRHEAQSLKSGWPSPRDAWKSHDKFVRACRWLMFLGPVMVVMGLNNADDGGIVVAFLGTVLVPTAAFYGYLRVVYKHDRKKALVLFLGASIVQGLFGRAVNGHIARSQPSPMPTALDPHRLNRVMRP